MPACGISFNRLAETRRVFILTELFSVQNPARFSHSHHAHPPLRYTIDGFEGYIFPHMLKRHIIEASLV